MKSSTAINPWKRLFDCNHGDGGNITAGTGSRLKISSNGLTGGIRGRTCQAMALSSRSWNAQTAIRSAANLLLEGFGEVQFARADLVPPLNVPVKRLNWDLFPQGHLPWPQVRRQLDRVIERAPPSVRPVIRSRTDAVERYGPDFVGIGRAGFQGYWVFGFTRHRLFVLESRLLDNATYILGTDWETVSQMTKAEVINSGLAIARLIHDRSWYERLDEELRHVLPLKAA